LQDQLKERLDFATFTEGSPVSEHAALRGLALEVGLPVGEVDAVLASDRYADAVRADVAQAAAWTEAAAESSKIRLRRMTYSQAAGFAATLPCGICPADLARRMPH